LWSARRTDNARFRPSTGSDPVNRLPCTSAICSCVHFRRSSGPEKLLPLHEGLQRDQYLSVAASACL
jgi:hypothetical protein